ncbi:NnrU family protein [Frateuria defendens]|uniref:NnrU family protein n=1 Tax=Frateuria defendens TaxID=2219559 RepID=UPI00066FD1EC|nr:NnrU family protein [Frateuria defendens]
MPVLILGLVIFLGLHSLRLFANGWRARQLAAWGEMKWKGLYSLVSIVGFVLIVVGFGMARRTPVLLYAPPMWLVHLNALFTLVAFVLLAAAYVPGNHIKAKLGHPMVLGVKAWAFGHLLAAGMLRDVVLFGAFLLWAIVLYAGSRRRDRLAGTVYPAGTARGDVLAVVIGVAAWALFAFLLHGWLIGVRPFG